MRLPCCREAQSQGDSAQFPYRKSALKVLDFRVVPSENLRIELVFHINLLRLAAHLTQKGKSKRLD